MADNNTGLLTSIWGPKLWDSLHCISFGFPEEPTEDQKKNYMIYFKSLRYILPCCYCRNHYSQHTGPNGLFEITENIFKNKNTLTKWVFELHTHVNKSLEIYYDITYEDICEKYQSYIAECNMSNEKKMIAHKNYYTNEAPFISYDIAIKFEKYANSIGLKNYKKKLDETNEIFKNKRINKKNEWEKRNKKCWKIIKKMRINGKPGFETEGDCKNLPTKKELLLFQKMCSSLRESILNHMIEKINNK